MKEAQARAARMGFPGSFIFPKDQPPIHKYSANGMDVVVDIVASEAYYAGDYKSAATCATRFASIQNFRGAPEIPGINVDVVVGVSQVEPIERTDATKAEDVANLLDDLDQALRDSSEEASKFKQMTTEVEHALGLPESGPSAADEAAANEMEAALLALRHFSTVAPETAIVPALEEDRDTRI